MQTWNTDLHQCYFPIIVSSCLVAGTTVQTEFHSSVLFCLWFIFCKDFIRFLHISVCLILIDHRSPLWCLMIDKYYPWYILWMYSLLRSSKEDICHPLGCVQVLENSTIRCVQCDSLTSDMENSTLCNTSKCWVRWRWYRLLLKIDHKAVQLYKKCFGLFTCLGF